MGDSEAVNYRAEVDSVTRYVEAVEDADAPTEPLVGSRQAPGTIPVPLSDSESEVLSLLVTEGPSTPFTAHLVEGPRRPEGPTPGAPPGGGGRRVAPNQDQRARGPVQDNTGGSGGSVARQTRGGGQ